MNPLPGDSSLPPGVTADDIEDSPWCERCGRPEAGRDGLCGRCRRDDWKADYDSDR